jgi:hypothetical protein
MSTVGYVYPLGHRAEEAAADLATLGMRLLMLGRTELAKECGETIASIARQSAAGPTGTNDPYRPAGVLVKLEQLARAAEALEFPTELVEGLREALNSPLGESGQVDHLEALQIRIQQLDEALKRRGRKFSLRQDSVDVLRQILDRQTSPAL